MIWDPWEGSIPLCMLLRAYARPCVLSRVLASVARLGERVFLWYDSNGNLLYTRRPNSLLYKSDVRVYCYVSVVDTKVYSDSVYAYTLIYIWPKMHRPVTAMRGELVSFMRTRRWVVESGKGCKPLCPQNNCCYKIIFVRTTTGLLLFVLLLVFAVVVSSLCHLPPCLVLYLLLHLCVCKGQAIEVDHRVT